MATSAVSYSRVSTPNQTSGMSLSEQNNIISTYAEEHGLKIVQKISEVKSGRNNETMLNYNFKKISNLIIADVSRFSRNYDDGIKRVKILLKKNINIHFVREDFIIKPDMLKYFDNNKPHDAIDKFCARLDETERESEIIAERIRASKIYKRARGEHCGGLVPYGLKTREYSYIDSEGIKKHSKKYEIDADALAVIRFIDKCKSDRYTTKELNDLMTDIVNYECDYIKLYDEYDNVVNVNNKRMTNGDIADLLNEFSITYKDKEFTGSIISRIKSEKEILSYIKDDSDIDDLINGVKRVKLDIDEDDAESDKEDFADEYKEFLEFKKFKKMMKTFRN